MKGRDTAPNKGDGFAALVAAAHELKSPLTLVQHLTRTLNEAEGLGLTAQERSHYLDRLQFTSERMLRLVNQLAISYRLEDDRQFAFAFHIEPISASEVFEAAAHELTPLAREYNQQLRTLPQSCPHLVLANREILYDIIVNLIDNAIRHNPRGSYVDIKASCRGAQVRLSVRDQGEGIRPAELGNLRRTLGTQAQPFKGRSGTSGLGLYIVGQFAEAMGGHLGLGRAKLGTHFFVDLMRSKQMSLL